MSIEQVLGVTVGSGPVFSVAKLPSALASTNATSVKAAGAKVFRIMGVNASAAVKYLKLYNKASAPAVGTDVPVATLALPVGAFAHELTVYGLALGTGFAYALTGAAADTDTTALAAADVVGLNILYL